MKNTCVPIVPTGTKLRLPRILIRFVAGILLLVVVALLAQIYLNGFVGRVKCLDETRFFSQLACGISETYNDWAPYFRSLPSDEEMIANFHKHRADFERLVRIYREDLSVPTDFYDLKPTPEVKAIMDRINVLWVKGDGVLWIPPDPYSTELNFLRGKAELTAKWGSPERRQFSGVKFGYPHRKVSSFKNLAHIYKLYYYIPAVPRIRDGRLKRPGNILEADPLIVRTLNETPYFRGFDYCAYREIEPHWFIGMCQTERD